MPDLKFVIVTSGRLPEAYFLAFQLALRAQHFAIVDVARPAGSYLNLLRRLRRTRGALYVADLLLARLTGLARRAALNRHLGMLPEFRGTDCPCWAFALERPEHAGYSIHVVSTRVDAGDIVLRRCVAVQDEPSFRVICAGSSARRRKRSWRSWINCSTERPCLARPRTTADATFRPQGSSRSCVHTATTRASSAQRP